MFIVGSSEDKDFPLAFEDPKEFKRRLGALQKAFLEMEHVWKEVKEKAAAAGFNLEDRPPSR